LTGQLERARRLGRRGRPAVRLHRLRVAPVGQVHLAEVAEEDVLRLDVAVEHASLVCIRERAGDLHERAYEAHERPLGAELGAGEHVLQAALLDDAHRVVRLPVREVADLVYGHDVRVLEPRGDARLGHEALDHVGRHADAVAQRLQRDLAAHHAIGGAHDLAEPARAEILRHGVARLALIGDHDGRARDRGHRRGQRHSSCDVAGPGVSPDSTGGSAAMISSSCSRVSAPSKTSSSERARALA
jgi:hypothetical protein